MTRQSGTVLVVDDHEAQLRALVELLESEGYRVRSASSFSAARALLETESPDILVSDVRLGAFNGLHLWLRVRAEHPGVAGLIISGYADPVIEQEARRFGAAFLAKPLNRVDFLSTIANLLGARTEERRRWPRTRPAFPLSADVNHAPASVVEVSPGGLRLRLPQDVALGETLSVRFVDPPISLTFSSVWRAEVAEGICCGASLADVKTESAVEGEEQVLWKSLIESMQGRRLV
jgi:CheY-like chemotaxis protein